MMKKILMVGAMVGALCPALAMADTISPISYEGSLAVGESVTVRKTVTISESVTSGVVDVVFLIDTSGSMGGVINAAKTAANNILTSLDAFGDVATGVGYYSEPGSQGVFRALTTDATTGVANINAITLGLGGNGGDFPEEGVNATREAALNTAWRPGSSRFIIALGDATFKESDGSTVANTLTALEDNNVTFIGLDFNAMTYTPWGGIDPTVFADATGGSIRSSSTNPAALAADIIASVEDAFATYSTVTVSDLGAGLPGVGVSVACVSADVGTCSGSSATGDYDRSIERTFEFDVTFTGLEEGVHSFDTLALVNGASVATEADRFTIGAGTTPVPEPATLAIFGLGLLGMGLARQRRRAE